MDLKKAEWEYDCGHGSDNEFSNLPPNIQDVAKKLAEAAFGKEKAEEKEEKPKK
jgi:hypothetical protein